MMNLIRRLKNRWQTLKIKLNKEPDWVTVYQSNEEYTVSIKKLQLEDAGIPAVIFNQRDSSYNAFGYIYLKVEKENEEKARNVLNLPHE